MASLTLLLTRYGLDALHGFSFVKIRGHLVGDSPIGGVSGRGVGGETGCMASLED